MKKFYLETYGCKLNQSDSDLIRGLLEKDFKETFSPKEADFIVINSCGVVDKTERKIIKRIKSLKGKKIIISGCLPLILPEESKKIALGILGPQNILSIKKAAREVLKGRKFFEVSKKEIDKANYCFLKKRIKNEISAIVPIAEGCLGNCTFCASRNSRGKLKSFSSNNILKEIKFLIDRDFKEIQLTSQDAAIYGLDDKKFLLPELLNKISKISGNFKLRVGMMNPEFAKKIKKELIMAFKSEKIYKFLHLSLQSGDDKILAEMKRGYKAEDFLNIIKEFKTQFKDILLATDVIVGYPGEDGKSFQKTLNIIKKIKPGVLHVFRFSKRKGTFSQGLKDFPERIKKERSRMLNSVWKEINLKENRKFLGKKLEVLVVEKRKNNFLARSPSFRTVILKEGQLGEFKKVKIIGFKENYLIGR
ncbi:MAG: tRNA (N(6)-L-threonylcarbamoyladenosine(37)-C(2))-methylthiotransferase [Candidatus Nealsonbacteria bacterium]|nr:tRNA (N(6)-L-threonylcarbamoyladenosine(37)-C(2))-methylthiotransferase [Candidatus Nealsonbacteria bacterium]